MLTICLKFSSLLPQNVHQLTLSTRKVNEAVKEKLKRKKVQIIIKSNKKAGLEVSNRRPTGNPANNKVAHALKKKYYMALVAEER